MKKVIINPSHGGIDSGIVSGKFIEKDWNLEFAKKLQNKLKSLGIDTYLTRDDDTSITISDRLNRINSLINNQDDVIVITIELIDSNESGSEIVYGLKEIDTLSRNISDAIESLGQSIIKFYQLRNPSNTSLDFYEIIRESKANNNLIVSYGNPKNSFDNSFLINNLNSLVESTANAINDYLTKKNIYIIKRGDTLFSIAKEFNITVDELKNANNLTNNALIVGEELIIPNTKELDNDTTGNDEEMDMYVTYIVKSGDSLYSIAKLYNTTVDVLKDINNLPSNTLAIGDKIKIPASNSSQNTTYSDYTVVKGDSLYSIATKFNTTVNEIKSINNLTSNTLAINQVLKIPSLTGNNNQIENYSTYTVKKGDSLYKIASLFETSINQIKEINNLTSNILAIGQVLKIPSKNQTPSNFINYTVKSGDSLYRIALSFNTTVNEIKSINNLTSNNLSIGQVLKIPN